MPSSRSKVPLPQSYNILSLDGGGVRGVLEAIYLKRIFEARANFLRDTDLIAGTSTGGIIALGLAAGFSPAQMVDLYVHRSEDIFDDTALDYIRDLWKLRGADYSTEPLREVLQEYFGDRKLRDLDKKVAIVSFDLDNEAKDEKRRVWKPKIFHNFDGPDSDGDCDVVDVALYTSAAPTYFPTVDGFVDGGVVANNPALVSIVQALDSRAANQKLEHLHLLSLGAGKINRYVKRAVRDWGIMQWSPYLLALLMEGSISMVDFECKQLLGTRYHRLDTLLEEKYRLDNYHDINQLVDLATEKDLTRTLDWVEGNWK